MIDSSGIIDSSEISSTEIFHWFESVQANEIDKIQYMLENGFPPDKTSQSVRRREETALMIACWLGHVSMVRLLLQYGADVTKKDAVGQTPFIFACKGGNLEIVQYLYSEYHDLINVEERTFSKETAFIQACWLGRIETVKFLFSIGADIEATTDTLWTPFIYACANGHFEVMKFLYESGANIHASDYNGWNGFLLSCFSEEKLKTALFLLDKGVKVNSKNFKQNTGLYLYMSNNSHMNAEFLEKIITRIGFENISSYLEEDVKLSELLRVDKEKGRIWRSRLNSYVGKINLQKDFNESVLPQKNENTNKIDVFDR